jgi:hypothetical protein
VSGGVCYYECYKCGGPDVGKCPGKPCDHSYKVVAHEKKNGRGIFGAHWECIHPECRFNDQANLYNTIIGDCYAYCTKCRKVLPNLESAGDFSMSRQLFSGSEYANPALWFVGGTSAVGGFIGGVAGAAAGGPVGGFAGGLAGGKAGEKIG